MTLLMKILLTLLTSCYIVILFDSVVEIKQLYNVLQQSSVVGAHLSDQDALSTEMLQADSSFFGLLSSKKRRKSIGRQRKHKKTPSSPAVLIMPESPLVGIRRSGGGIPHAASTSALETVDREEKRALLYDEKSPDNFQSNTDCSLEGNTEAEMENSLGFTVDNSELEKYSSSLLLCKVEGKFDDKKACDVSSENLTKLDDKSEGNLENLDEEDYRSRGTLRRGKPNSVKSGLKKQKRRPSIPFPIDTPSWNNYAEAISYNVSPSNSCVTAAVNTADAYTKEVESDNSEEIPVDCSLNDKMAAFSLTSPGNIQDNSQQTVQNVHETDIDSNNSQHTVQNVQETDIDSINSQHTAQNVQETDIDSIISTTNPRKCIVIKEEVDTKTEVTTVFRKHLDYSTSTSSLIYCGLGPKKLSLIDSVSALVENKAQNNMNFDKMATPLEPRVKTDDSYRLDATEESHKYDTKAKHANQERNTLSDNHPLSNTLTTDNCKAPEDAKNTVCTNGASDTFSDMAINITKKVRRSHRRKIPKSMSDSCAVKVTSFSPSKRILRRVSSCSENRSHKEVFTNTGARIALAGQTQRLLQNVGFAPKKILPNKQSSSGLRRSFWSTKKHENVAKEANVTATIVPDVAKKVEMFERKASILEEEPSTKQTTGKNPSVQDECKQFTARSKDFSTAKPKTSAEPELTGRPSVAAIKQKKAGSVAKTVNRFEHKQHEDEQMVAEPYKFSNTSLKITRKKPLRIPSVFVKNADAAKKMRSVVTSGQVTRSTTKLPMTCYVQTIAEEVGSSSEEAKVNVSRAGIKLAHQKPPPLPELKASVVKRADSFCTQPRSAVQSQSTVRRTNSLCFTTGQAENTYRSPSSQRSIIHKGRSPLKVINSELQETSLVKKQQKKYVKHDNRVILPTPSPSPRRQKMPGDFIHTNPGPSPRRAKAVKRLQKRNHHSPLRSTAVSPKMKYRVSPRHPSSSLPHQLSSKNTRNLNV